MPRRRERVEISYRLVFTSPFHCGTGMPAGLTHRSVLRDEEGFLVVPGSSIKGAVRERCEDVARRLGLAVDSPHQPRVRDAFGPPASPIPALFGSHVQPGTLFFDDAMLTQEWREFFHPRNQPRQVDYYRRGQIMERTRVSLSRLTGAARSDALFTSEYGIPGLAFDGRIHGIIEDWPIDDERTFALSLLAAGVLAVGCLGADRSTGAGRCTISQLSVLADGHLQDLARLLEGLEVLELYPTGGPDE
jgi:CRISPR/Cas system CSM-associated protein Csm3 (group 7 of RAMP superfamily)